MKTFGEKLKELRIEKKLTQKELAKILSITIPTLSHWECDYQEPSLKDLIHLCVFFNVESDYLIGLSEEFENITIHQEKPIELPHDEQELLDKFRLLNFGHKVRVDVYAKLLLDQEIENGQHKIDPYITLQRKK